MRYTPTFDSFFTTSRLFQGVYPQKTLIFSRIPPIKEGVVQKKHVFLRPTTNKRKDLYVKNAIFCFARTCQSATS